jgi:hypothetical protein
MRRTLMSFAILNSKKKLKRRLLLEKKIWKMLLFQIKMKIRRKLSDTNRRSPISRTTGSRWSQASRTIPTSLCDALTRV